MNRRLSKGLSIPLFLLMIFALVSCDGCDDPAKPIIPGAGKNFGPPLYDVIFVDGQSFVATVDPDGTSREYYLQNVGNNQDFSTVGIGVLYKMDPPGVASDKILLYDESTSSLIVMDEEGDVTFTYEDVLPNYYSASESRIARIKELDNGNHQIQSTRWGSGIPVEEFASIQPPYYFASRPSFDPSANRIVISIYNADDATLNRIGVWGETDHEYSYKMITALSPQYSPTTRDTIAYIEAPDGPEAASSLILIDNGLEDEYARFNFSSFGVGATSFSWSNDGYKIALYADVFGPEPKIVVIDLEANSMVALDLGEFTVSLGSGDDLIWAFPEWGGDDNELVFPGKIEVEGVIRYHVVKYSFIEESATSISDMSSQSTHPHWKKYSD